MAGFPATPLDVTPTHIVSTPGICGGKPRIAGTRIWIWHVVQWVEHDGLAVDEVVRRWPQLTRADIHSALAYYHDHRAEVDAIVADEAGWIAEYAAQHPEVHT